MRGIDVSNWQQSIYLPAMPIDFAIAKASEGIGYRDPAYTRFASDCLEHVIPFGAYHFARENSPEQEARYFYSQIMDEVGYIIPILDYETSNRDNVDWCERFMMEFHDYADVWPWLYISASRCGEYADSWIPDSCKLWLAGYPYPATEWTQSACPYNCWPWNRDDMVMWQFTSSLILPGYNGRLDGNIAYIGKEQWNAYAKGDDLEMVTDSDIEKIAQRVWEYTYKHDGMHDTIIQDMQGIPDSECNSNRYNVLNQDYANTVDTNKKLDEIIELLRNIAE